MCCRSDDLDMESINRDKTISKNLAADKRRLREEFKLLLLGGGESGKSTIAKQLKILYYNGFNPDERIEYIPIIHANIHNSVQSIVKAAKFLGISFMNEETQEIGEEFMGNFINKISQSLGQKIEEFWKDEAIPGIMDRRNEFQILDNTEYFVKNINRVTVQDYIPSDEDIIRSRAATTGIIETSFTIEKKKFILVDVGGQRSERKKWMHCFDNVSALLFCVAISAFDLTLYEDNITNRMHEALKLFHEVCASKWFTATAIILFLNKSDLFKIKLAEGKSISAAFPEFNHGTDYEASTDFIQSKFTNIIDPLTKRRRDIYSHITTATDTSNIMVVFDAVKNYVITEALKRSGFT